MKRLVSTVLATITCLYAHGERATAGTPNTELTANMILFAQNLGCIGFNDVMQSKEKFAEVSMIVAGIVVGAAAQKYGVGQPTTEQIAASMAYAVFACAENEGKSLSEVMSGF
ncbi:hypothetical protein [uncultured Tateyamaria sp.]|uniref:hypothetical protein n=1 Tax=Tateyamaria sp. 1078 TaxID=3417464 RepID=UPI0026330DFB|nr:hypothetical protein [uncultured Tateyamaria sp.]